MDQAFNKNYKRELEARGYVLIKELWVDRETVDAISLLGSIMRLPGTNEKQVLKPLRCEESTPNTYSGNYGRNEFPLHTDLAHWSIPPRFFALRCITGSPTVATKLLDSQQLFAKFGREKFRTILVQPRKVVAGRRPLLRLFDIVEGGRELFRWDPLFNLPATKVSGFRIFEIAEYMTEMTASNIFLSCPGDTLVIDNWRMLHGRSSIDKNSNNRKIERVYMKEFTDL